MNFLLKILSLISIVFILCSCNGEGAKEESKPEKEVVTPQSENHPSIQEITAYIQKTPNDPKLYYVRSNMRFQLGNLAGAKEDIQKALELDSTQINFYIGLADVYFEEQDLVRAINTLEEAIKIDASNEKVLLQMAIYKIYMKNYKEAIGHLDAVLEQNIYNAEAYFYKGILFKEIDKKERALSSFQTALEQNPEYFEAHMQLALTYADQDPELALQYYDNALKLNPKSQEAMYGKGLLLQNLERYSEAIDIYKEIVKDAPRNSTAFYNIGYVYFLMDSMEKSDRNFKIASTVDPTYVDAVYMRGLIQEALGNLEEAAKFYKQSLSLQSDYNLAIEGLERIDKNS